MTKEVLNILVVDDDPVGLQLVQRTLNKTDLNVEIKSADSVQSAVDALSSDSFDIAIVDYRLPDGTALSILKAEKKEEHVPTPTIVLTAHNEKTLALEAIEQGAQDFLLKENLSSDGLERAVRYALQRTKLINQLQEAREHAERERELRLIKQSVTAEDQAVPPVMQENSEMFKNFAAEYHGLLLRSFEEANFKTERVVPAKLRDLTERLGELGAGPKDVVNIHASAIETISADESKDRASALTTEGKVLLVQLMGYLCDYYRLKRQ